jgi:carotenoid cleavage dioxygenase-like enzyme
MAPSRNWKWKKCTENMRQLLRTVDLESDEINKFHMVEFRLFPQTGEVTKELIDDSVNVEFCVAPKMGSFVRYGYTAIQDPSTPGEGSFAGFCVWDMLERKLHSKVLYDGYVSMWGSMFKKEMIPTLTCTMERRRNSSSS